MHEHATFGRVMKPATTTEKGEEQRTCSICGFIDQRNRFSISRLSRSAKPSAAPTTAANSAPTHGTDNCTHHST